MRTDPAVQSEKCVPLDGGILRQRLFGNSRARRQRLSGHADAGRSAGAVSGRSPAAEGLESGAAQDFRADFRDGSALVGTFAGQGTGLGRTARRQGFSAFRVCRAAGRLAICRSGDDRFRTVSFRSCSSRIRGGDAFRWRSAAARRSRPGCSHERISQSAAGERTRPRTQQSETAHARHGPGRRADRFLAGGFHQCVRIVVFRCAGLFRHSLRTARPDFRPADRHARQSLGRHSPLFPDLRPGPDRARIRIRTAFHRRSGHVCHGGK